MKRLNDENIKNNNSIILLMFHIIISPLFANYDNLINVWML